MIASFFRHLEQHGVRWLLISGLATILYGAATFSEDVDLWVLPTEPNFERFKAALRESQARYYKLTPALSRDLISEQGFAVAGALQQLIAGRMSPIRMLRVLVVLLQNLLTGCGIFLIRVRGVASLCRSGAGTQAR